MVFHHLQEVTNFTSTCRRQKNGFYGSLVNGQWTGMVKDVLEGEADVGAAAFDITKQRSTVIDYLIGISFAKYLVIMKRPSKSEHIWTAYTKEFRLEVWLIMLVFLIGMIFCLSFTFRCLLLQPSWSISQSAITITGFIFFQGTTIELMHGSVRMVALTVLMFHVVLLTYYTSDLISGLAAGIPALKIDSILDVANDPDLRLGFKQNTAVEEYMRESSVEAYRKIWQDSQANNDVSQTAVEGMQRVLTENNYMFLLSNVQFHYIYSQDCRYIHLPTSYFRSHYTMIITKGSPLIPLFNEILLKMLSSGLIDKLLRDWIPKLAECSILETSPVDLRALSLPFLLLGGAMITSLLILWVELLVFKQRNGIFGNWFCHRYESSSIVRIDLKNVIKKNQGD